MKATVKAPDKLKRGGVYEIELDGMAPEGGDKITMAAPEGVTVIGEHADELEKVNSGAWVAKQGDAAFTVAVSTLASGKDRTLHITVEDTAGEKTERDVSVELTADDAELMDLAPDRTDEPNE